ncbi:DUF2911 domain-containing protein [Daejeonella lutea]|uniref:DUF2911 domain-containing protein n=1 Tax=Daejeonella lutea TaxID=572036 RepID=A0A1T5ERB8_9SPHI|nr:DUF2911 domain-containing protein [Daejeonella lutea]SKB86455.1 Protein of unknown function [Daejeonella lutea]
MKQLILALLITGLASATACAQRPSPAAKVSETISSGTKVTIDYSQPGIKGRTIGKEIAPWGKVWRTGANEATVFEVNKNVTINGKSLPKGKYSLYSIPGQKEWVIILNKTWNQSGTEYDQKADIMRFTVKTLKAAAFSERMTFKIAKSGVVSLVWGNYLVNFTVK